MLQSFVNLIIPTTLETKKNMKNSMKAQIENKSKKKELKQI